MTCPPWHDLPGAELVEKGLEDLASGQKTLEAVLLQIGAVRLSQCGLLVPPLSCLPFPEDVLYEMLRQEEALSAHSRYNALIRRLISFESGLERRTAKWAHPSTSSG